MCFSNTYVIIQRLQHKIELNFSSIISHSCISLLTGPDHRFRLYWFPSPEPELHTLFQESASDFFAAEHHDSAAKQSNYNREKTPKPLRGLSQRALKFCSRPYIANFYPTHSHLDVMPPPIFIRHHSASTSSVPSKTLVVFLLVLPLFFKSATKLFAG